MNSKHDGRVLLRTDADGVPSFVQSLRYEPVRHVFLARLVDGRQATFEAELVVDQRPEPGCDPSDEDFATVEALIEKSYLLFGSLGGRSTA